MNCTQCQKDIDAHAKFCPYCGFKIVSSIMKNCVKCMRYINDECKFCPYCGAKIDLTFRGVFDFKVGLNNGVILRMVGSVYATG